MSTEFGPTNQRYDDGGSEQYVPDASDTSPWNESSFPNQPEYAPASAGNFFTQVSEANERQSWIDKIGRARLAIAGIATGSVLTGVIVGIGVSGKSNERGEYIPPTEAGTSAPAVPGNTPSHEATSSSPETKTEVPYSTSVLDTPLYKELTLDQQSEIKRLDGMTYEAFSQLDYNTQLKYAEFYFRAYEPYGMEMIKDAPLYDKHAVDLNKTTKESSGQTILDDFSARQASIYYSLAENGVISHINENNRNDAKKALAYLYDFTFSNESTVYKNRIDELSNLTSLEYDPDNTFNTDSYHPRTVVAESITSDKDIYGGISKRVNVTNSDGTTGQYMLTYTTFKDIEGQDSSVWQVRAVVGEGHPMFIPDVKNAYKE